MAIYNNEKDPNEELWEELNEVDLNGTTYSIDIPQCFNGKPIDEWRAITEFKTWEEALQYAQEHFGADENGMICLISQY